MISLHFVSSSVSALDFFWSFDNGQVWVASGFKCSSEVFPYVRVHFCRVVLYDWTIHWASPSPWRPLVPKGKSSAVALYKLATCAKYSVVAETFTSVWWAGPYASRCLANLSNSPMLLKHKVIAHHNSTMHLVPSLYCELYIPILPPSNGYRDHVNQKGWPSIVLQVLEDDQFHIKDICVGSPGSAAVFTTSNLIPDNPSVTLLVDFRGKWLYPYVSLII